MSETKHTPWEAKQFLSPPGTFYVQTSSGFLIVVSGKSMDAATANLISAAPELLEALKASLPLLAREFPLRASETYRLAEQAIAKAEGKA